MTKTFINSALAAVAALTFLPAIASAQPANAPARKPVAAERKIEPAKPAGPQAKRPDGHRPGPQAKRDDHRQQFAHAEGLGQVVVCTCIQQFDFLRLLVAG